MSFKVIENDTIRKHEYDFLFAFRDRAKYWSKIVSFRTPEFDDPDSGVPVGKLP